MKNNVKNQSLLATQIYLWICIKQVVSVHIFRLVDLVISYLMEGI